MTFVQRLAQRIQRTRRRRGLSQAALAAKARISREYLARLETGRQDPRASVVVKLAKALKVKVAELLE